MTAVADEIQIDEAPFRGDVVRPGDPNYDVHRKIWNGSFDRHPALIIRCAGVSDVIAAVRFGRESGLPVAVRSGGHSFPGLSVADDALMIDLQPMKGVRVDPEKMTARVQAGVLLGELDKETQAFGLAVPSGIVTHTGVAGLTLGGGIGWIMRKHGLSVDQLVSMDVVTADGEFVKASADENPDLFWGLRGGGGNFGIVTEFEFNCVPLGTQVLAGPIIWPMEQSGDVLRFYRDWVADAPDDLMTIVVHRKAPPLQINPPLTSFPIWQMGGAVARVDEHETPFGGRRAAFTYNIGCATETADGFDEEREWVRSFWSALEPWHQTVYVNFLENEGEERIRAAYGAEKYDRLRTLKQKYDPQIGRASCRERVQNAECAEAG